jgi:CheY-like chemotaxis protein
MKASILIIEDNEEMRENISDILQLGSYIVKTATNGKSGIDLAIKEKPDLILCDIMMPELDGYGVLHILSKQPETSDIPFIFLTAKAEKSDFRKGMNLGADDYIVKPFDGLELLKAVEIRLKKNEHLKTTFENSPQDINGFLNTTRQLSEFREISTLKSNRLFKKKEFIYKEGQHPSVLYYILKGEIKTSRVNSDGKEFITGLFGEGEFLGYVPLLKDIPYAESAVALCDTEVGTMPKQDFHSLVYTNRAVASRFLKILSNHLFNNEKRLLDLAYQSVRQRVAAAIVYLYHQQKVFNLEKPLIKMVRRDIAGIVGTSLESVNRTIADFREEGFLEILEGGIQITDMKKLESLSQ